MGSYPNCLFYNFGMQMSLQPKRINVFIGYPKEALGIHSTLKPKTKCCCHQEWLISDMNVLTKVFDTGWPDLLVEHVVDGWMITCVSL